MENKKINSWQEDFRFALKSIEQVNHFFNLNISTDIKFDILIPFQLAHKIKEQGPLSVLWKQFIPSELEMDSIQNSGLEDPIGDQKYAKEGSIVHRYPNRALFFPTTICPVICRYCFRKNELSNQDDIFQLNFNKTIEYFKNHPEIEEVIFSGGDPLMLSNEKMRFYFSEFSKIESIKYLRLHTRSIASMPLRIDDEFCNLLEEYANRFDVLSIAIHLNHCDEIDKDVEHALVKLSQIKKINLLSQSVLLKNINDNCESLENLFKKLVKYQVKPYYLHHPDKVKGGMHFQIDIETGRKIYANLRCRLPGWMIPTYILDTPDAGGKLPIFNPENFDFSGKVINLKSSLTSF